MIKNSVFDLEKRTYIFAKNVRLFIKQISITFINAEDIKQLLRSSGSIGANYIEANEALGKKDFLMRMRISRKEAKETAYWLKLILESNELGNKDEGLRLYNEAIELKKILSSIIVKSNKL